MYNDMYPPLQYLIEQFHFIFYWVVLFIEFGEFFAWSGYKSLVMCFASIFSQSMVVLSFSFSVY